MTALDTAHAAMEAGGDAERLAYYGTLAGTELHLLLDDTEDPQVIETEDGVFVLSFDSEVRLAMFAGEVAMRATLSGRTLAAALAGQGIGLGVNLGVAETAFLMPPDAVDWLARTLAADPAATEVRPVEIGPPGAIPDALLTALDTRLAATRGLARTAYLAAATYADGAQGTVLAFVDTVAGAEAALAQTVSEALVFSGLDAGALDVAFFPAAHPLTSRMARVGLQVELPEPERMVPVAPGSDGPPTLR